MPIIEQGGPTANRLVFRVPGIPALRVSLTMPKPNNPLSSILFLAYGFAGLAILGTILLILPVSSSSGQVTSPVDALFTAISAVCVTGLVVVDTGTYWSTFGQAVLLVLFQIGGLGFIIGATLLLLALGRGFQLRERLLISESMGVDQLGGILGVIARVALFAVVVEGIGVTIFYFRWADSGDPITSVWTAVFHAASAFNNSGMDIFGNFKSLSAYQGDTVILLTTSILIILGSTGYVVVADCLRHRSFNRLSLDSKIVLVTTFSLIMLGTLFYLLAEFSGPTTLGQLPFPEKILVAFFQSVTPRTAGLTAIDIGSLRQTSLFFTMFLMWIGGATGSAAGGMKVNTFGVLAMTALSLAKGRENIEAFGRQLTKQTVYRAITLLLFYLAFVCLFTLALSITEVFPVDDILFETFSAIGTVGLTTGITPSLSIPGRLIIILAMFIGRLGPLTLIAILAQRRQSADIDYPRETIRLG